MSEMISIGQAVQEIKSAILQSQLRVAQMGNKELLALYFSVGRYIAENSRVASWGTGAIDNISNLLQKEMPGLRGFSARNMRNMRKFYEEWNGCLNLAVATAKSKSMSDIVAFWQLQLPKLNMEEFVAISFTHHVEIISKIKDIEERLYYIRQSKLNQWTVPLLRKAVQEDLYHHQALLPNNFKQAMPDKLRALKAISMFKDEYLLDFMNTEELGVRDVEDLDERVLEQHIVHNVKNFIMTFGRDFTFVGNQYHLEKFGHDLYPDLLFYNRELACLVAIELKKGDFKPAYLGQLSAYLRVLDDEVKKPFENPSIGIVLC